MSGTDLPKISDETLGRVAEAISEALDKGGYGYWINTTPDPDLARAALDALVASGYRREADVQAEIAATFRSAAAGRREYADGMPRGAAWEPSVELLNMQATTLESAALAAEGQERSEENESPSCARCGNARAAVCCSSHGKRLCHLCYRRTHFVEVCADGCPECAAAGLPVKLSDYGRPVPEDGTGDDGAPVADEGTEKP